jgi:hypothetical protein
MENYLVNNEKLPARAELLATLGKNIASGGIGVKPEQAKASAQFFADLEAGRVGNILKDTAETFPAACIDGRASLDSGATDGLKTAGGWLSYWAAYRLTGGTMNHSDFLQIMQDGDLPIGGHTDDHDHQSGTTGCGANDKLPEIIKKLTNPHTSNLLFNMASLADTSVDAFSQVVIEDNAKLLTGTELGGAAERTRNLSKFIKPDQLTDRHREVAILLNERENTAVGVSEITKKYGTEISAFVVDVWAFQGAAEKTIAAIEASGKDREYLNIASSYRLADTMSIFNLATASVLCAPGMKLFAVK